MIFHLWAVCGVQLEQERTLFNDLRRNKIRGTEIAKNLRFDTIETWWFISHNFFNGVWPPPLLKGVKNTGWFNSHYDFGMGSKNIGFHLKIGWCPKLSWMGFAFWVLQKQPYLGKDLWVWCRHNKMGSKKKQSSPPSWVISFIETEIVVLRHIQLRKPLVN